MELGKFTSTCHARAIALAGVLLFLTVFTVCVANEFTTHQTRVTLTFDARHYFDTTRLLYNKWFLPQSNTAELDRNLAEHLIVVGPVLPAMAASLLGIFGKHALTTEWRIFVYLQSILQALGALAAYLLMFCATRRIRWSLAAGLGWGLYPAAVIASGRFLPEISACTFTLMYLLALYKAVTSTVPGGFRKAVLWIFIAGLIAGALLLLKSSFLPEVVLAALVCFGTMMKTPKANEPNLRTNNRIYSGKALLIIAALLCGMGASLLPWANYTRCVSGCAQMFLMGESTSNVAVGNNFESDGWDSIPTHPWTQMFNEKDGPLAVQLSCLNVCPLRTMQLISHKISRYILYPWNEFRHSIFGIFNPYSQAVWHQLICCMVLAASVYVVISAAGLPIMNFRSNLLAELLLVVMFSHICYLAVEGIPRYGFTAMPFEILLVVLLIYVLRDSKIAMTVVIASAICMTMMLNLTARQDRLKTVLFPGGELTRFFDLTPLHLTSEHLNNAFVLIDGDKNIENSQVYINGCKLADSPSPFYQFMIPAYLPAQAMRESCAPMNKTIAEERQWRAVPIPIDFISSAMKSKSMMIIALKNYGQSPSTLCATMQNHNKMASRLLNWENYSPARMHWSPYSKDGRVEISNRSILANSRSAIRFHDPGSGITKLEPIYGDAGVHVLLCYGSTGSGDASEATYSKKSEIFHKALKAYDFDPTFANGLYDGAQLRINGPILKSVRSNLIYVEVPGNINASPTTHIRVRISGMSRSATAYLHSHLGLEFQVIAAADKKFKLIPPQVPPYIAAGDKWHDFAIEDVVPCAVLPGGPAGIEIGLYPGPWEETAIYGVSGCRDDVLLKDLQLEVTPCTLPLVNKGSWRIL